jgi:hypothetical protein
MVPRTAVPGVVIGVLLTVQSRHQVARHFSCAFCTYTDNVDNGFPVDLESLTKRVVKGLNQLRFILK